MEGDGAIRMQGIDQPVLVRTPEPLPMDAVPPPRIAELVEAVGVKKAQLGLTQTVMLAILAGAFIAFGAMFFTTVVTCSGLSYGPTRMLGGIAFSLGLILVVVGGAELFTGINLIVMAWADGKVGLDPLEGFFRGILGNTLVCLAVWLCFAANTVPGKVVAIIFPIAAFVALGFEHSVANMYLITIGWLHGAQGIDAAGFLTNMIPVTLGNIVGGGVFVALVYWIVYLRPARSG